MFLSSVYLSLAPQFNVGCFNVGVPSYGPMLVSLLLIPGLLSLVATGMACAAAFMASTAACVMACVIYAWFFSIPSVYFANLFC